jgi:hypothetical protein
MAELRSAIFWVLNCPIYLLRCHIIASVVAQVMAIVGKLLCLTAPERMTGKETIYISVMFDLISINNYCLFSGHRSIFPKWCRATNDYFSDRLCLFFNIS